MAPPKVFVSYSHADEEWKDRLVRHLGVLRRQGLLDVWDDRRLEAGTDWRTEIQAAIQAADVALLLVSADFLNSDFVLDEEVPRLLERRASGELRVFPIIARACAWRRVDWLQRMQVRPWGGEPLAGRTSAEVEAALAEIVDEISRTRPPLDEPPTAEEGESHQGSAGMKYLCYVSRERLNTLFEQLDEDALARDAGGDLLARLSFGYPGAGSEDPQRRRGTVLRLAAVVNNLERTARLGDLNEIVAGSGRLDCDWYDVSGDFSAEAWDPREPNVYLQTTVGDYALVLSCAKANFSGLSREENLYIPTSTSRFLFEGGVALPMQGLVRVAGFERETKTLRGAPLYLVLNPLDVDLGELADVAL